MEQKIFDQEAIIKFLLDDLSDAERAEIEARYFADDDFFEEVSIVEEELIEAYIEGELSGRERVLFENSFFASPARRARVEFAEILKKAATRAGRAESLNPGTSLERTRSWLSIFQARNRAFQWAMAAAALILAIGIVWMLATDLRSPSEPQQAQKDQPPTPTDQTQQPDSQSERNEKASMETSRGQQQHDDAKPEVARATRPVAALELFSSQTRGSGDLPTMKIPPGGERVRIKLYFQEADYNNYSAALQTSGGRKEWSKDRLKARRVSFGRVIKLDLPASLFSSGDYVITLNGTATDSQPDEIGVYEFKVVRK